MNTQETEDTLGIQFCHRQPISIERGEGAWVWDEAGNKYLDFTSGWGVTCLGHASEIVNAALNKQAGKLIQNPNSGFTYSPSRAALLVLLQKVLPGELKRVYFVNSGAEANDAALKLARKITGRQRVVTTHGSFHGRTFNTLSASGGPSNTSRYLPQMPDSVFVPYGDTASMLGAINSDTAAVLIEPIQGEGGVRIPPPEYLCEIQKLCSQYGALLLIDEIQTGYCRTGRFFAIEHSPEPVYPDMLTMGKGIAGGFPFAAFAVTEAVASRIELGDHGGTYCGNPLGCAVATAVAEHLLETNMAVRVCEHGERVFASLCEFKNSYPQLIQSVRAAGLLCAVELGSDGVVGELVGCCLEQGLLVTPTRNGIVRLLPPLNVTAEELEIGLERFACALAAVAHADSTMGLFSSAHN